MIIISYALVSDEELKTFSPKVAILNENNKIVEMLNQEPEATIIS